jgi:hypothetical protein
MLHNLFYFPQNAFHFIFVSFPVQIIFMRTALFCVITQKVVVNSFNDVSGQPIGSIFREPTGCPGTSVLNNPEEHSSHLLHCRSLKSQK